LSLRSSPSISVRLLTRIARIFMQFCFVICVVFCMRCNNVPDIFQTISMDEWSVGVSFGSSGSAFRLVCFRTLGASALAEVFSPGALASGATQEWCSAKVSLRTRCHGIQARPVLSVRRCHARVVFNSFAELTRRTRIRCHARVVFSDGSLRIRCHARVVFSEGFTSHPVPRNPGAAREVTGVEGK